MRRDHNGKQTGYKYLTNNSKVGCPFASRSHSRSLQADLYPRSARSVARTFPECSKIKSGQDAWRCGVSRDWVAWVGLYITLCTVIRHNWSCGWIMLSLRGGLDGYGILQPWGRPWELLKSRLGVSRVWDRCSIVEHALQPILWGSLRTHVEIYWPTTLRQVYKIFTWATKLIPPSLGSYLKC
jgi:hypothetical protein